MTERTEVRTQGPFEPHYSTMIFRGYLKVLLERHSRSALDACFGARLGVDVDYLLDQNNWLSEEASEIFYDCVETLEPGNLTIDFEAGKSSLSVKDLGVFTQFVSTFLSLETLITSALRAQKKINKVDKLLLLEHGRRRVRFEVRSSRSTNHLHRIANNWLGFLSAFPKLFGFPAGRATLSRIGDRSFEVELVWKKKVIPSPLGLLGSGPRGRIRWSAIAGMIAFRICLLKGALLWGAPLFLGAILMICLEIQNLQRKTQEDRNLEELINRSEQRYAALFHSKKELDTLYLRSRVLSSVATKVVEASSAEEVIHLATSRLHEELGFDKALFFIKNEENDSLELLTGEGIPASLKRAARTLRFPLSGNTGNPEHIVNIFQSGHHRSVQVTADYLETLTPPTRRFLEAAGIEHFLAFPVSTPSRKLGVLFVSGAGEIENSRESTLETLGTVAQHLAMSLEKSLKLEEEMRLRTLFESYVSSEVIHEATRGKGRNLVRKGNAVILFCDLRGFTRMMHQSDSHPDSGFELIQGFYETVNDAVYSRGGIVNKFLGDGALAVFEVKDGEDPTRVAKLAISAALGIQTRAAEASNGLLRVSAGIHSGQVTFATVGRMPKLEFTVLGDAVNLSSRLCHLSKELDNRIVISKEVNDTVQEFHATKGLGNFRIRGLEEQVDLYCVDETDTAA